MAAPVTRPASLEGPHVVIVGGGFGGLAAARALRGAPVNVTLIDRRNHHVFQPLLYQVATAALSPGDIASPIRWVLRRQANVRVLLAEATRIDAPARTVHLDGDDTLVYDYLIVASGAGNAYFGHDDWAPMAPALKTLDDALAIRRRMLLAFERAEREPDAARRDRLLTFVIVGGGPTGVEMAGALAEIARQTLADEFRSIRTPSAHVVLVEAGDTILSAFPEDLRQAARRSLVRLGVDVRERARVTAVVEDGVDIDGARLSAGTVIWAAGVAASPLGRTIGAPVDRVGRVIVERDLSVPGYPNVFVVGDLASFTDDQGRPLPGVAQVAIQQAKHAARTLLGRIEGRDGQAFVYKDLGNMATIGRAAAIADLGRLRFSGFVAWLLWLFIHLVWLIGFRSRLIVLIQWAAAYLTYQRNVRLITSQGAAPDETATPAGSRPAG